MTSPPPSETGATAEERAREIDLECTGEDDHDAPECPKCDRIRLSIAFALLMAKRSAHLEDARAGCKWCRPMKDLAYGYAVAAAERQGEDGFWGHTLTWPSGMQSMQLCERPEVWDALSLLPSP